MKKKKHIAIPEARRSLAAILAELKDEGLTERGNELHRMASLIISAMYRRPRVKQARAKNRRMNQAVARQIWEIFRAEPKLSNEEIGTRVGVNAGRVSEVLHGVRFNSVYQEFNKGKVA